MNRIVEILVLLAVAYLVFFTNLYRHDYVKTEGLRAVVVDEMLQREGLTMPTVHQTPYLKKPPLYAWTTSTAARAVGRFDEEIARMPSAVAGVLLVLLTYWLGERWIGPGGGFPAGVFALLCPTICDYAVRAELDLPFSFFCTACLSLTLAAMRAGGAQNEHVGRALPGASGEAQPTSTAVAQSSPSHIRRFRVGPVLLWAGAYFFALAAAMWKGPHSLIFMWLTMIGFARLTRDWSFLRSIAQWAGLAVTLGVLLWWTKALSAFAGPSTVGRAAGVELLVRLVPYKLEHILDMVTFIPMLILITLPASAFALLSFRRDVRIACGVAGAAAASHDGDNLRRRLVDWWQAMIAQPLGVMILAWLIPNLIFMLWAPAKSPRYTIPIFPPIFLLGAWMALRIEATGPATTVGRHGTRLWRFVFGFLTVLGLAALIRLVAGFSGITFGIGTADNSLPWLLLGIGLTAPMVLDLTRRAGRTLGGRLLAMLFMLICAQPVLHTVYWPSRTASDSQREVAQDIDAMVPEDQRLYVLGKHEFPDTQIYSQRQFVFVPSIDAALTLSGGDFAFVVVEADELEELTEGAVAVYAKVYEFERADSLNLIIRVRPAGESPAAP